MRVVRRLERAFVGHLLPGAEVAGGSVRAAAHQESGHPVAVPQDGSPVRAEAPEPVLEHRVQPGPQGIRALTVPAVDMTEGAQIDLHELRHIGHAGRAQPHAGPARSITPVTLPGKTDMHHKASLKGLNVMQIVLNS
ncbi:hypothetical protein AB0M20_20055 [Actinoplanes sp. NPDC051633]|uniref:hypothetical protein n=1 Tax=Actinoplanes sp. NPDC051633 TaxID=3155670 RepID=UPI00343D00DF